MKTAFFIKTLTEADCAPDLFAGFNRYQDVKRCWRSENGAWVLKDIAYIEQWDEAQKQAVRNNMLLCVQNGGTVIGAFAEGVLVGFASIGPTRFGRHHEYVNLDMLHTSYEHRNKGIGARLFAEICHQAKASGASKLYISAHSAEDSMAFYRKVGCVDAVEVNQRLAKEEPCDCQLEYVL